MESIIFRFRTGCAWRDVPERFRPWQTVWKRHTRFSRDGTWDKILAMLLAEAGAASDIDWAAGRRDGGWAGDVADSCPADREPALLRAGLSLRTVRLAPGLLVVGDSPSQIRWGTWPPEGVAAAVDLSWVLLSVQGVVWLVDLRDPGPLTS